MNILFVHQNFPGQFKHLAPALVQQGHTVMATSMKVHTRQLWQGVTLVPVTLDPSRAGNAHPWLVDFQTKVVRAEATYFVAKQLNAEGFVPHVIVAHPGWGESLLLKEVWPEAKLGIYTEFFYHNQGADVGFDPEFPIVDADNACRLRLKNTNYLMYADIADAAIAPTHWQASTFPSVLRDKITVIHDGIDTDGLCPNAAVQLTIRTQQGEQLTLSKQDKVITFVNRNLEPYRGYHVFMRSLPGLFHQHPDVRVVIIGGDGVSYGSKSSTGLSWKDTFMNEVTPLLSAEAKQRIHFLGSLPYSYYVSVLQLSRVHVYLTYPFVLSWSLLEAMSIGCTIVASDTQPVKEVIKHGETGLLFNFFDSDQLLEQITMCLTNTDMSVKLGEKARAYAVRYYDLKSICLPSQLRWVSALLD